MSNELIYIYGARFSRWVKLIYQYIALIPLFVIFIYVNFINGESLLIVSLSLISVGFAVSILTFEYSQSIRDDNVQSIVFEGGRRFYLATLFSIFFLIFVVLLKFLTPFSPNMINYALSDYTISYIKGMGVGI